LSSALAPAGTDSCGRFGRASSSPSISPSTRWRAASSSRIRSLTARISCISAEASSPRRLAAPIASDVRLRRAFSSSAVLISSRRCRSASSSSLRVSSLPPRVASARATASGCSRMSFSGSNGWLRRFGRTLLGLDAGDGADAVIRLEVDDAHAPRVAALGGDVGRGEPDDLALRGDDENVVRLPHLEHPDDVAVAATGLDVDDALARAALQPVLLERRPLAVAALGHGQDRRALLQHVGGDHLVAVLDLDPPHARRGPPHRARLLLGEADDHAELRRDHDLTLAVGPPDRDDLVAVLEPDPLDPAGARVRVRLESGLLHLPLLRLHPGHALAAAPLAPIGLDMGSLDVAGASDRDDHLFVGEQVLDRELGGLGDDLGAALVAVLLLEGEQLLSDDRHDLLLGGEDPLQLGDQRQRLLVLLDHLVALELGQPLQPHVQDGLGLDLAEVEPPHQRVLRRVGALRLADQADHEVELLDRLPEAGQDVRALLGAGEVEPGPARHDLAAEADEGLEHLLEVHHLRPAVDEGEHDDPEGRLHLRVLEELVEDDLRNLVAAELEHHSNALAVRLVADLRDALELLLAPE